MNDSRSLEELRVTRVDTFNWAVWRPGIRSTLVFILREDEVLLIDKKTGLGQGKVNGPGGKLERGETWLECARREVHEELLIAVDELHWVGELRFLMSDCPDILCHVFFAYDYTGVPTETREARPFWCPIAEVPFNRMWTDDRYWLPRALSGDRVLGRFVFEGETLLDHDVTTHHEVTLGGHPRD